jgi:purine-nucleoside phosphorylase
MSTVPEVIQAAALGMPVLGISAITNLAAGLSPEPLNHEDVLEVGRMVRDRFAQLVRAVVADGWD